MDSQKSIENTVCEPITKAANFAVATRVVTRKAIIDSMTSGAPIILAFALMRYPIVYKKRPTKWMLANAIVSYGNTSPQIKVQNTSIVRTSR